MRLAMGISLSALMLLTASCSQIKNVSRIDPKETRAYPYSVSAEDYRIHAGDELEIKFYYTPELNDRVTVRPDGRISLQLAHEIMAAGLTPAGLRQVLTEEYSKTLKNPEITIIVRAFSNLRVYVDGEVAKPGLFPLVGTMTVLQAISQAGGIKDSGLRDDVVVIRRGPEDTPLVFMVNTKKVTDGTDLSQDIVLRPYDIVHVPRKAIVNVDLWIDQYINQLVPQFGFIYSRRLGNSTVGIDTSAAR